MLDTSTNLLRLPWHTTITWEMFVFVVHQNILAYVQRQDQRMEVLIERLQARPTCVARAVQTDGWIGDDGRRSLPGGFFPGECVVLLKDPPGNNTTSIGVCLFVCGISLTSGQLISELFPDCTRSCFSQVVLRRWGDDRIYEMRCLFVAVGPNACFIVLPHWDNMS